MKKNVEDIRKNIMVPLDYMFDDHHLCDSKRYYKKDLEEYNIMSVNKKSERKKVRYYMCKMKDKELYKKLCKKYEFYTTEEKLFQCKHEYDTQIN